ncbi:hypothetical protein HYH03_011396 [Edaphochlamys debaryana]|uniref:Uncharacterized protein n=1 Tax=Edaphochlamys debaryana TaxID=47281 RepID=A0A836BV53_9CHLO|nr:hypothetical protein HYH03_011396 [Edaphochlamys debaryana]|eukprot:KAG2490090.1 hypothetical protein HYH03_011396 [Edaphochlamys debaryana]
MRADHVFGAAPQLPDDLYHEPTMLTVPPDGPELSALLRGAFPTASWNPTTQLYRAIATWLAESKRSGAWGPCTARLAEVESHVRTQHFELWRGALEAWGKLSAALQCALCFSLQGGDGQHESDVRVALNLPALKHMAELAAAAADTSPGRQMAVASAAEAAWPSGGSRDRLRRRAAQLLAAVGANGACGLPFTMPAEQLEALLIEKEAAAVGALRPGERVWAAVVCSFGHSGASSSGGASSSACIRSLPGPRGALLQLDVPALLAASAAPAPATAGSVQLGPAQARAQAQARMLASSGAAALQVQAQAQAQGPSRTVAVVPASALVGALSATAPNHASAGRPTGPVGAEARRLLQEELERRFVPVGQHGPGAAMGLAAAAAKKRMAVLLAEAPPPHAMPVKALEWKLPLGLGPGASLPRSVEALAVEDYGARSTFQVTKQASGEVRVQLVCPTLLELASGMAAAPALPPPAVPATRPAVTTAAVPPAKAAAAAAAAAKAAAAQGSAAVAGVAQSRQEDRLSPGPLPALISALIDAAFPGAAASGSGEAQTQRAAAIFLASSPRQVSLGPYAARLADLEAHLKQTHKGGSAAHSGSGLRALLQRSGCVVVEDSGGGGGGGGSGDKPAAAVVRLDMAELRKLAARAPAATARASSSAGGAGEAPLPPPSPGPVPALVAALIDAAFPDAGANATAQLARAAALFLAGSPRQASHGAYAAPLAEVRARLYAPQTLPELGALMERAGCFVVAPHDSSSGDEALVVRLDMAELRRLAARPGRQGSARSSLDAPESRSSASDGTASASEPAAASPAAAAPAGGPGAAGAEVPESGVGAAAKGPLAAAAAAEGEVQGAGGKLARAHAAGTVASAEAGGVQAGEGVKGQKTHQPAADSDDVPAGLTPSQEGLWRCVCELLPLPVLDSAAPQRPRLAAAVLRAAAWLLAGAAPAFELPLEELGREVPRLIRGAEAPAIPSIRLTCSAKSDVFEVVKVSSFLRLVSPLLIAKATTAAAGASAAAAQPPTAGAEAPPEAAPPAARSEGAEPGTGAVAVAAESDAVSTSRDLDSADAAAPPAVETAEAAEAAVASATEASEEAEARGSAVEPAQAAAEGAAPFPDNAQEVPAQTAEEAAPNEESVPKAPAQPVPTIESGDVAADSDATPVSLTPAQAELWSALCERFPLPRDDEGATPRARLAAAVLRAAAWLLAGAAPAFELPLEELGREVPRLIRGAEAAAIPSIRLTCSAKASAFEVCNASLTQAVTTVKLVCPRLLQLGAAAAAAAVRGPIMTSPRPTGKSELYVSPAQRYPAAEEGGGALGSAGSLPASGPAAAEYQAGERQDGGKTEGHPAGLQAPNEARQQQPQPQQTGARQDDERARAKPALKGEPRRASGGPASLSADSDLLPVGLTPAQAELWQGLRGTFPLPPADQSDPAAQRARLAAAVLRAAAWLLAGAAPAFELPLEELGREVPRLLTGASAGPIPSIRFTCARESAVFEVLNASSSPTGVAVAKLVSPRLLKLAAAAARAAGPQQASSSPTAPGPAATPAPASASATTQGKTGSSASAGPAPTAAQRELEALVDAAFPPHSTSPSNQLYRGLASWLATSPRPGEGPHTCLMAQVGEYLGKHHRALWLKRGPKAPKLSSFLEDGGCFTLAPTAVSGHNVVRLDVTALKRLAGSGPVVAAPGVGAGGGGGGEEGARAGLQKEAPLRGGRAEAQAPAAVEAGSEPATARTARGAAGAGYGSAPHEPVSSATPTQAEVCALIDAAFPPHNPSPSNQLYRGLASWLASSPRLQEGPFTVLMSDVGSRLKSAHKDLWLDPKQAWPKLGPFLRQGACFAVVATAVTGHNVLRLDFAALRRLAGQQPSAGAGQSARPAAAAPQQAVGGASGRSSAAGTHGGQGGSSGGGTAAPAAGAAAVDLDAVAVAAEAVWPGRDPVSRLRRGAAGLLAAAGEGSRNDVGAPFAMNMDVLGTKLAAAESAAVTELRRSGRKERLRELLPYRATEGSERWLIRLSPGPGGAALLHLDVQALLSYAVLRRTAAQPLAPAPAAHAVAAAPGAAGRDRAALLLGDAWDSDEPEPSAAGAHPAPNAGAGAAAAVPTGSGGGAAAPGAAAAGAALAAAVERSWPGSGLAHQLRRTAALILMEQESGPRGPGSMPWAALSSLLQKRFGGTLVRRLRAEGVHPKGTNGQVLHAAIFDDALGPGPGGPGTGTGSGPGGPRVPPLLRLDKEKRADGKTVALDLAALQALALSTDTTNASAKRNKREASSATAATAGGTATAGHVGPERSPGSATASTSASASGAGAGGAGAGAEEDASGRALPPLKQLWAELNRRFPPGTVAKPCAPPEVVAAAAKRRMAMLLAKAQPDHVIGLSDMEARLQDFLGGNSLPRSLRALATEDATARATFAVVAEVQGGPGPGLRLVCPQLLQLSAAMASPKLRSGASDAPPLAAPGGASSSSAKPVDAAATINHQPSTTNHPSTDDAKLDAKQLRHKVWDELNRRFLPYIPLKAGAPPEVVLAAARRRLAMLLIEAAPPHELFESELERRLVPQLLGEPLPKSVRAMASEDRAASLTFTVHKRSNDDRAIRLTCPKLLSLAAAMAARPSSKTASASAAGSAHPAPPASIASSTDGRAGPEPASRGPGKAPANSREAILRYLLARFPPDESPNGLSRMEAAAQRAVADTLLTSPPPYVRHMAELEARVRKALPGWRNSRGRRQLAAVVAADPSAFVLEPAGDGSGQELVRLVCPELLRMAASGSGPSGSGPGPSGSGPAASAARDVPGARGPGGPLTLDLEEEWPALPHAAPKVPAPLPAAAAAAPPQAADEPQPEPEPQPQTQIQTQVQTQAQPQPALLGAWGAMGATARGAALAHAQAPMGPEDPSTGGWGGQASGSGGAGASGGHVHVPVPLPIPVPVPVGEPGVGASEDVGWGLGRSQGGGVPIGHVAGGEPHLAEAEVAHLPDAAVHVISDPWSAEITAMLQHCHECPQVGIAVQPPYGGPPEVVSVYAPPWARGPAAVYVLDCVQSAEVYGGGEAGEYAMTTLLAHVRGLLENEAIAKIVHGCRQVAYLEAACGTAAATPLLDSRAVVAGMCTMLGIAPPPVSGPPGSKADAAPTAALPKLAVHVAEVRSALAKTGLWSDRPGLLAALAGAHYAILKVEAEVETGAWVGRSGPLAPERVQAAARAARHLPELWAALCEGWWWVAVGAVERQMGDLRAEALAALAPTVEAPVE